MNTRLNPLKIGNLVIPIPIIQGGMGVQVSTSALASAVAEAGGAGTIASVGLGYGTKENEYDYKSASTKGLQREIRQARKNTGGAIGVNIMVALSNYGELVKTADEEKVDYIVSGAGLPLELPEMVTNPGIKLIPIVSSARAADLIIKVWKKRYNRFPDAIIVEGPLAGGHLGFKMENLEVDKMELLEDLVSGVIEVTEKYGRESGSDIPVIAAGGIFDGLDIARFFNLGARGVQMGSRFVATHECSVADEFKNMYLKAEEKDIVIIKSPVGMPGRAITTKLIEKVRNGIRLPIKCNYRCLRTCDPKLAPYCIARALFNAASGLIDDAVVFSGSCASRVRRIVKVRELLNEVITEAVDEINRLVQKNAGINPGLFPA